MSAKSEIGLSEVHATSLTPSYLLHRLATGWILPLATAILFVVTWAPRFARSFWGDEAGTFWMVHDGFLPAIQKTATWPGQSILYSVIASFFCLDGTPYRDFLLRIPSLAGLGVAAYFLFRLAEKNIGRGSGLTAIILFLFHPGVLALGFQARPYALAMAAVTASCWALTEWVQSRSRRHLLAYIFTSALVIYLHYLFVIAIGIQALYFMYVGLVERRTARFYEIVAGAAASVVLAAPLLPSLRLLNSVRQTMPFMPPPSLAILTDWLSPAPLMAGLVLFAFLLMAAAPFAVPSVSRDCRAFLVLIGSWWLLGPLVFCLASQATSMRIFVPRYLAFSLPGQSLLLAFLVCRVLGSARARLCAFAAVLLFAANPALSVRARTGAQELLPVMRIIRSHPEAPVFFPSLLQESLSYDWKSGNQPGSYLFAPLVAYPISNTVLPLPVKPTDEAREFASQAIDRLGQSSKVLFVDEDQKWSLWILDRMKHAGFQAVPKPAGNFTVFEFTK